MSFCSGSCKRKDHFRDPFPNFPRCAVTRWRDFFLVFLHLSMGNCQGNTFQPLSAHKSHSFYHNSQSSGKVGPNWQIEGQILMHTTLMTHSWQLFYALWWVIHMDGWQIVQSFNIKPNNVPYSRVQGDQNWSRLFRFGILFVYIEMLPSRRRLDKK